MIRYITLITICLLIGCERPSKEIVVKDDFVMTNTLKSVKEEFNKLPEADKDLIYKQFAGSALFIQNAKSLGKTSDFDPILARVQSDFGWDREKHPDFTSAISKFLEEQGYDEPKELNSEENRKWFYNIFYSLSMAIKND